MEGRRGVCDVEGGDWVGWGASQHLLDLARREGGGGREEVEKVEGVHPCPIWVACNHGNGWKYTEDNVQQID